MPGKASHRIIILYNLSTTNKLNYDFGSPNISLSNTMGLTCNDEFVIEPLHGSLEPS